LVYRLFTRLDELEEDKLELLLELECECLSLAYSPKTWLVEKPSLNYIRARWESEEASNYYLLSANGFFRGYVYIDPGGGVVYSYLCPHTRLSLRDNVLFLLGFLRDKCVELRAAKTIIWLGLEHSIMHKTVVDAIGSPHYYTWYYRMYYRISSHGGTRKLNDTLHYNYRIVFGGIELASPFLEIIHDAFGEELEWLNHRELEKWFKETRGKIILAYLDGEPVGAGYFHYNTSLGSGQSLVGYIPLLGVKKKYWGKGAGKTLVYSIIEYLAGRGVEYAVIDCLDELVEYYRKLGFKNAGRIISINITPTLI